MKNQSWALFPAALVAALAVAGCGLGKSSSAASPPARPSATVLRDDVMTGLNKAKSVHVSGTEKESGTTYAMNLGLTRSGASSGSVSVGHASFTLLSTGGHTYIEVTAGFMKYAKLPSAACSLMCGKYLELSPSDAKSMVGSLSLKSLFDSVTSKTFTFRYGGNATVNGQPAWLMLVSDGSTLYVSTQGKHYLLRAIGPRDNKGQLDFTQWNSVKVPPVPPASKVVNLSQLQGS